MLYLLLLYKYGTRSSILDILTLGNSDIKNIVNISKIVELVEVAFREKALGRVQMPPKIYVFFDRYHGDLRAMPAYLESFDIAGVKLVNSHPMNPSIYGLPTVVATIMLFDPRNGVPLCIMDGTWITGARTGGAAAVATKYLARDDSSTVGLVGAGFLAMFHVEAFTTVMDVDKIYVYDVDRSRSERLAEEVMRRFGLKVLVVDTPRDAVEYADVLATLTPAKAPIVMDGWVREGLHINAMGADAPGKQEMDHRILKRAKIVVDDFEQAIHSGEVNVPISQGLLSREDLYAELGEVVTGLKSGREHFKEVTVFDSTGLAVQDVIVAHHIYVEAVRRGLGTKINI